VHAARSALGIRVGFVVSRAVGGAVVRNRVKRRLRAAMAEQIVPLSQRERGGSCDIVVRATAAAGAASFEDLRSDLAAGLAAVVPEPAPVTG
jgi:ribonuclease P protein component